MSIRCRLLSRESDGLCTSELLMNDVQEHNLFEPPVWTSIAPILSQWYGLPCITTCSSCADMSRSSLYSGSTSPKPDYSKFVFLHYLHTYLPNSDFSFFLSVFKLSKLTLRSSSRNPSKLSTELGINTPPASSPNCPSSPAQRSVR